MSTRWTLEQQLAINSEGKNIIVSAGAGSGKTAVLTERVLRKIKSGINIDNLLILTFTKAAAYEMKERIRKNLKKADLKDQLDIIEQAYITTFDSYALSIVKKYHYLLNISKNVKICEASVIALKKEQIIEEIFENYYNNQNPLFLKLINDFCLKDDTEIKNYIIEINNKLDMKYDKIDYLNNYINFNYNEAKIDHDINLFTNILLEKITQIKNELKNLNIYVDGEYYEKILQALNNLLNASTYLEIKNNLNLKLPTLPRNSLDLAKKAKDNINSIIKELKEICCYNDIQSIKSDIISTKEYAEIIVKIMIELDQKINQIKYELDSYEFNDIAKMAIKILKENEEIREELKYQFNEILVDEYQDTNDLQETFIKLIENNNIYMVGDIKQSIYRFRNANPYIFKNKYDNYANNNGGMKIDLNKNFRSRRETLDNINIIFNIIMDDLIGGADYKNSHQMIFGNTTYENEGKVEQNNNFEIYNYTYNKTSKFTKEETEIFIIAHDIKEKIKNKYKIFDKDELKIRNIEYKDFVILLDRTTNFNLYKKIFEYLNIPLTLYKDETITNGIDIFVIRNILKLILKQLNKEYDEDYKYCFTSIARSFLFSYSDNEIFNIIKNSSYKDSIIINKINKIIEKLDHINNSELIKLIIDEFEFYENLIKIGNIEQSMVRIEYLNNLALNLSGMNYTIDEFIKYIDEISKKQYEIKYQVNSNDENSVKIMTIHKSKGLEYHICYYASLYSKFNTSDIKEKIIYDNSFGIIIPSTKDGMTNTIYKYLLKDKYLKEEISEKIRLFYVALTRCKEKMIMIADLSTDNIYTKNRQGIIDNTIRLKYTSFLDMLKSISQDISKYITNINLEKIELTKAYNIVKEGNFQTKIPNSNKKIIVKSFDIKNESKEEKVFSKNSTKLLTEEERKNIKLGKNVHYLLEILDFKNPNIESMNISEFYKRKLKAFLANNQIGNIKNAKIYKEYEFKYEEDNKIYHGIIDLILEYDDNIKIIDYKLKNIKDENYLTQIAGYKKYIENKTNKKVSTFLYSIIDEKLEQLL